MIQIPDDVLAAAGLASVYTMLTNVEIPIWKRVIFCIVAVGIAGLTTQSLVVYFGLPAGFSGMVSFLVAATSIPITDLIIRFIRNPATLVDLVVKILNRNESK